MKKHYDRLVEPYLENLMKEFPAVAIDGLKGVGKMVREFDKIKLKNGEIGYITDKLDDTHFYADISKPTGEISTAFITIAYIASVFVETERPISDFAPIA